MIHYSCDRCKRPIHAHQSVRYVVKMEVEAALDTNDDCCDEADLDCLAEMDVALDHLEDDLLGDNPSAIFHRKQFDLCPDCYREFIKNPVGREKLAPFGFSKN